MQLWNADEELLLRASLARPSEAAAAWERLRPRFHLNYADHEWYRMIPLVWRNLSAAGVEDPELARMKGVFKRTWADTNVLLHDLEHVLRALEGASIDTLVIKGAGLVASGLMEPGTRFMDDIDIVVPPSEFEKAEQLLMDRDWARQEPELPVPAGAAVLVNSFGRQLDLHRRVAPELALRGDPDGTDVAFRSRATAIEVRTATTRTLAPGDHLMLVCVHGFRSGGPARLHWVPDAAALVRDGAVDWETLIEETERRRAVLTMRRAFAALLQLDLPVPPWVRSRLVQARTSPRDHLIHWALTSPPPRREFPRLVRQWLRRTSRLPLGQALTAAPRHVQRFYGITEWREVPGRFVRRVARR
jgi:Uncharacterised nucleotidyltransferase